MEIHLSGKFLTLPEVSNLIKSLYGLDTISPELMELLINYLVDQGYDAEDFANILGIPKACSLIHRLCVSAPDKIQNNNFLVHVDDFIRENLPAMSKLQLLRLQEVVSKVPRYQSADGNDLAEVLRNNLMLGGKKDKGKAAQKIPTLNEDFKSEAY